MSVPGKEELESRFHDLTESLIQKQTVLEALSSEKSSLNVQLQRLKVKNWTRLPTLASNLASDIN